MENIQVDLVSALFRNQHRHPGLRLHGGSSSWQLCSVHHQATTETLARRQRYRGSSRKGSRYKGEGENGTTAEGMFVLHCELVNSETLPDRPLFWSENLKGLLILVINMLQISLRLVWTGLEMRNVCKRDLGLDPFWCNIDACLLNFGVFPRSKSPSFLIRSNVSHLGNLNLMNPKTIWANLDSP